MVNWGIIIGIIFSVGLIVVCSILYLHELLIVWVVVGCVALLIELIDNWIEKKKEVRRNED